MWVQGGWRRFSEARARRPESAAGVQGGFTGDRQATAKQQMPVGLAVVVGVGFSYIRRRWGSGTGLGWLDVGSEATVKNRLKAKIGLLDHRGVVFRVGWRGADGLGDLRPVQRCEAFSTYPRTYDLIHVVGITSLIRDPTSGKSRCHLLDLMVEMDRILRPEGKAVMRDSSESIEKAARIARAIRWTVEVHGSEPESHSGEKILVATKTFWKLPSSSH